MIVFGHNSKVLGTDTTPSVCPSCGQRQVFLTVAQKYAHIFWIPTFPLPRMGFLSCGHCKQVRGEKEFTITEKENYLRQKGNFRTPIWFYAGILIFGALILFGINHERQKDKAVAELHKAPQVGDIYVIRAKDPGDKTLPFRILKIESIKGEDVDIRPSNWGYPTSSSASRDLHRRVLDKDYFSEGVLKITNSDLQALEVLDVQRKN